MKEWFENKSEKYRYRNNQEESVKENNKQSSFIKSLTPRDTEEIKPGLFIQRTKKGYRQINPAAWDGKINWKNFLLGKDFWKSFIWFVIILFLAWSYFHDVAVYKDFYEETNSNPAEFCANVSLININEIQNTYSIQNYDGKDSREVFPE